MNAPLERLELVRLSIEKAEEDYLNFQNTLKMGDDCPYNTVCFHAQQCVEKYLKARLVYLSIDFSKTHDIGDIVQLLPPGTHIPLMPAEQEQLTNYAWKGRYPGNWTPINRKQAEEAAALAIKVRSAIRAGFPKKVLGKSPESGPTAHEPPVAREQAEPYGLGVPGQGTEFTRSHKRPGPPAVYAAKKPKLKRKKKKQGR